MKLKILTIIILYFSFSSCSHDTNSHLIKQIQSLKILNDKLKDSLNDFRKNELMSNVLIAIPDTKVLKVNEKTNFTLFFHKYSDMKNYKVIRILNNGKELVITPNSKKSIINYEFTPKSIDDNQLNIHARFNENGEEFDIIGNCGFKVIK